MGTACIGYLDGEVTMLKGPIALPQEGTASRAVVFLHGFGSDGDDLIALAPMLAEALPNTAFFAPNAPQRTSMGMGYQWFDDKNFTFINREGIGETTAILETYLTQVVEAEHGIPLKNTVIFAFSQGTMTALFAFPRLHIALAGIIASSGRSMWHEELETATAQKFPLLLMHGIDDDVVPYQGAVDAEEVFKNLGYTDVNLSLYKGLAHGIGAESIADAANFINRVTKP